MEKYGWVLAVIAAAIVAVWSVMMVRRKRAENKYRVQKGRMEERLPDGRNGYLRMRLQTTLAVASEERLPTDANLLHAQKLLYALTEKRLSGADSLIARKLRKDLGRYAMKEYYSAYEKGELSGLLSKLLTLCAKYEV